MAPIFRRRRSTPAETLLPLLFGNVPVDEWPPSDEGDGMFVRARAALRDGSKDAAVELWRQLATNTDAAARDRLQAWTFLRANGVNPPVAIERDVFGVVVEVPVAAGRDVLASYDDGSCRYLNHAGAVVIGDAGFGNEVQDVIAEGERLAGRVGTWDKPTLPELPPGHARVTLLTPGGLRFGQGPGDALLQDASASPVFAASARLLARIARSAP
jgi:hypothetical protein